MKSNEKPEFDRDVPPLGEVCSDEQLGDVSGGIVTYVPEDVKLPFRGDERWRVFSDTGLSTFGHFATKEQAVDAARRADDLYSPDVLDWRVVQDIRGDL